MFAWDLGRLALHRCVPHHDPRSIPAHLLPGGGKGRMVGVAAGTHVHAMPCHAVTSNAMVFHTPQRDAIGNVVTS
eukprot:scaffold16054_cov127-Isochrysis_galbana.AAC.3